MAGLTGFSINSNPYSNVGRAFQLKSPLASILPHASSHFSFASPFVSHGINTGGSGTLTADQMLQLMHAQSQHPQRSFVGSLLHDASVAAQPIVWGLDKLMRPTYAIASGADALVKHQGVGQALHMAKEGIEGHSHTTFSKVLGDAGVLKGHGILRGIAGFGLDVAADPTTYLTLGVGGIAKNAAEHAGLAVLKDAGEQLSRKEAGRLAAEMGGHAEVLRAAGTGFEHRAALADTKAGLFRKQAFGAPISGAERKTLNIQRAAAKTENDLQLTRKFQVGYRIPGTFGKKNLQFTTPIGVARMSELADKHIPLLSSTLEGIGQKLVPGYRNEIVHSMLMSQKHAGEHLATQYTEAARAFFSAVPKMSHDRQLSLLHMFETPGGVIKKGGEYVLNPARLAAASKAGFSDKELQLVHAIHGLGQFLHAQHGQFGMDVAHLGEKGQLYVPHIYKNNGEVIPVKYRNMLSERGFVKGRSNTLSLQQIEKLKQTGALPKEVETDPFKNFVLHIRSVAQQHADKALINYAGKHLGTPARLVDEGALTANLKGQGELRTQMAALHGKLGTLDTQKGEIVKQAEDAAVQRLRDAQAGNRQKIMYHMEVRPHDSTTMATLQRLSKYGTSLHGKYKDELAAIRDGTHPSVKNALLQHAATRAQTQKELAGLHNELLKVAKGEGKIRRGTKNLGLGNLVESSLKNEHGHALHFPEPIAKAVTKMEAVTTDDKTLQSFTSAYRKYLGKWKIGVTSVNPGYGVRNSLTDFWNMWLSGVPLTSAVYYGGKAAKLMRAVKNNDPHAMSILLDAYDHGVLSGLFQGDVEEMRSLMTHSGSKTALIKGKKPIALYAKIMGDLNRNRENWGRLTHYLYRRDAQHMGIAEAAQHVRAAHFDYEDLTPFERNRLKLVAPFYTWTRKNVPFQVKHALMHPGLFSAFPKAAIETQNASGNKPEGIVPSYLAQNFAVRVPGGRYLGLGTYGPGDLNKLDPHQLGGTLAQLISPALSVPFEMMTGKNLYTGQDISPKNHTRVPVNDSFAQLLSLIPGSNVGLTQRGGHFGAGMDPKEAFLLGQLPMLQSALFSGGKIKGQNNNGLYRKIAYLSGINLQSNDQKIQQIIAQLNEKDAFTRYKAGIVDANPKLYATTHKNQKLSSNQQFLNNVLLKALSGGR